MQPYSEIQQIRGKLKFELARNPNHPGAIHLYFHLIEYARPELAETVVGAEFQIFGQ